MGPLRNILDGVCRLGEEPGLGVVPDPDALRPFAAAY
jgi:hypothetical protein